MVKRSRALVLFVVGIAAARAQTPPAPPVPQVPPPPQVEVVIGGLFPVDGSPLPLGSPPPAPEWGPWQRGEPIVLGAAKAPACSVFLFYNGPRAVAEAAAAGDADYVADLQRRFREKGLRIAVVVTDPETTLGESWNDCSVVVDVEQRVASAWGTGFDQNVVAFDRAGLTVFQGSPGSGLVDGILMAFDGSFDAQKEIERASLRELLRQGPDNVDFPVAAKDVVALARHDGSAWGGAYLLAALKANDAPAAKAIRRAAIEQLANEGRPLAEFADLALRGDPGAPELATDLAAALQPITAALPQDPVVQLAFLRALIVADRGREVGRHAARTAKLVRGSAEHSATFAEILLHAPVPAVHADLVKQATQRSEELGGPPRAIAALKYTTALRCDNDEAAAKAVLATYLGDSDLRSQLNNDCWYAMTQTESMGRFPWFAVALAERMLEQKDNMDYFEFDTVAMAMAGVGRFAEAVKMQETAIQKGGMANGEYTERLKRYQARLPSKPQ